EPAGDRSRVCIVARQPCPTRPVFRSRRSPGRTGRGLARLARGLPVIRDSANGGGGRFHQRLSATRRASPCLDPWLSWAQVSVAACCATRRSFSRRLISARSQSRRLLLGHVQDALWPASRPSRGNLAVGSLDPRFPCTGDRRRRLWH